MAAYIRVLTNILLTLMFVYASRSEQNIGQFTRNTGISLCNFVNKQLHELPLHFILFLAGKTIHLSNERRFWIHNVKLQ